MDLTPPPGSAPGAPHAYARSELEEFLTAAAAERARLEHAIDVARDRERLAGTAVDDASGTLRLLESTLRDLQGELSDRRRGVEVEAHQIVTRGQEQATAILRLARIEALTLLRGGPAQGETNDVPAVSPTVAAHPVPTPPAPQAPPLPQYEPSADTAVFAPAAPGPQVVVVEPEPVDIDLVREELAWASASSEPDVSTNGASSNGASSNGASSNGSVAPDEAELHAPKAPGIATLMRRGRSRAEDAPADEEADEFFDFLRGALVDDEPLGPRTDDER